MNELDGKVKALLDRINVLCRMQTVVFMPSRAIEINTLIGAVRMIEGKPRGADL